MRLVTRFCSLFAPFNLTPYFLHQKHRYNNQKPCPGEANLRYGLKSHWTTGEVIRLHLPSSCSSRWPVGRCCWEIWAHPYRFDACGGSQPSARLILWSNQGGSPRKQESKNNKSSMMSICELKKTPDEAGPIKAGTTSSSMAWTPHE